MGKKTIVVTGSTDGIGRATALDLAQRGHRVIVHGRKPEKGQRVRDEIRKATGNDAVDYCNGDLSSLAQVRQLARDLHTATGHIDVLINNAGVWQTKRSVGPDGNELTLAVNFLAPFALTLLTIDLLRAAPQARVVNVASQIQARSLDLDNLQGDRKYSAWDAYGRSKLYLVMFTYGLARRAAGTNLTTNVLHPGVIDTKMLRKTGMRGAPVERGADRLLFLALDPSVDTVSGKYFVRDKPARTSKLSRDEQAQDRLWRVAEDMTRARWR